MLLQIYFQTHFTVSRQDFPIFTRKAGTVTEFLHRSEDWAAMVPNSVRSGSKAVDSFEAERLLAQLEPTEEVAGGEESTV